MSDQKPVRGIHYCATDKGDQYRATHYFLIKNNENFASIHVAKYMFPPNMAQDQEGKAVGISLLSQMYSYTLGIYYAVSALVSNLVRCAKWLQKASCNHAICSTVCIRSTLRCKLTIRNGDEK